MFGEWNGSRLDGLDPTALANLAAAAGCPSQSIPTAVAVAMAESYGNPAAHNTSGEDSRGIWQINAPFHPEFAGQNLFDPNANAAAMYQISNGCQNWRAWGAFTNKSYLKFLDPSLAPSDPTATDGQGSSSNFDLSSFVSGLVSDPASLLLVGLGLFLLLRR